VVVASPLSAQMPLSFRDALALTGQQNQQLRAAEAQVERSRATRSAARGLYYPTVSAAGLYAHMNDRLFVDLDGLRPILSTNRGAQAGVSAAEQEHRLAEHGITTELVDRYFKRRLAADVLEVRRQALATLTQHLDDARRLKAAGQIARTDELRAEVSRAEADRDFKKAGRDVQLASVALRSTLGN
jgi:outer membrane protein TolC